MRKDAVQSIKILVEPLVGEPFELTESDLVLDGYQTETHSLDGEMLEIGNMNAAVLNLTLDNEDARFSDKQFAGAKLLVRLGIQLEGGGKEEMPFGVYTVDEQPRSMATIAIEAYDNMVLLDIPFSGCAFPISIRALVMQGIEEARSYL